jgi:hypothetical protein
VWIELYGKVKVHQSMLGISENAVSYAPVDENRVILAGGGEGPSVAGDGLD